MFVRFKVKSSTMVNLSRLRLCPDPGLRDPEDPEQRNQGNVVLRCFKDSKPSLELRQIAPNKIHHNTSAKCELSIKIIPVLDMQAICFYKTM